MARHTERILDFSATLLGDLRDAEDATQETLIDAFRSAAEFDGRANAGPWLLGIAYNRCRRLRRRRQQRDVSLDDLVEPVGDDSGDAPASLASDADMVATRLDVRRVLGGLPEEYRIPIILRFQQGLTYAEIAQVLEISESAAAMRLHRGRALLRDRLGHLHEGQRTQRN